MRIVTQFRIALGSLAVCAGINVYATFFISHSVVMQVAASFLGTCIMVHLFIMTFTKLEKPFAMINKCAERVANGDLTTQACYTADDELGSMVKNYGKMVTSLNATITTVVESANTIINAIDNLTTRAEDAARGARNQSGQSQHIATATEEMSRTITDIARNMAAASETSSTTMHMAEQGQQVADGASSAVNRVYDATINLATMVEKLNNRINEISGIATVIKGIADQTNLLALNAAIEAARAGEQGRGFAVVADEVRKLAERTIKATAEITERISSVKAESDQTAKSMESASGEVIQSTEHIGHVRDALTAIVTSVQKVRDQITQIAVAVEEQSATAEEVATNIEKTAGITKEMEKGSEDVTHEVHRLSGIVEELRNSTAGFTLQNAEQLIFDNSKTDHVIFMKKISAHLKGDVRLDPGKMPDHHTCRFGKWYENAGRQQCGSLPSYRAISQPHERIHTLAREVVSTYTNGDAQSAEKIYAEMKGLSLEINQHLDELKRESMRA
jgi:methyl-accepting chemotaxis protein